MKNAPASPSSSKPPSGGCVPMITLLVGMGMLLVGLLAIPNTAFGWELELEVYGTPLVIPKHWDSTIGVLVVGAVIALVGWLIGTPRFLQMYRKNKLLVILGAVGILSGIFFALNEYDKSIRRKNAERFAQLDSLEGNSLEPGSFAGEEAPAYNPYADKEIAFVVTNPTVDTMTVYVDREKVMEIKPYEFGKGKMGTGVHRLAAVVKDDTLEALDLDLPVRTQKNFGEIWVLNVDSFFNIAVLNFQDYYDADNRKRRGARTVNYKLQSLHWHEHLFAIDGERASLVLPRSISIDISLGKALKLVILPDEWKDDKDNAFDYAIWKFIDEEKKGYTQDDLDFYMLPADKKKKAIRNRLPDDVRRFKLEK